MDRKEFNELCQRDEAVEIYAVVVPSLATMGESFVGDLIRDEITDFGLLAEVIRSKEYWTLSDGKVELEHKPEVGVYTQIELKDVYRTEREAVAARRGLLKEFFLRGLKHLGFEPVARTMLDWKEFLGCPHPDWDGTRWKTAFGVESVEWGGGVDWKIRNDSGRVILMSEDRGWLGPFEEEWERVK